MADEIVSALLDLFPDQMSVEPYVSANAYGDKTYGPSFDVTCRITGRMKMVRGMDGQEHVTNIQVIVAGDYFITPEDRVTLPVEYSTHPQDPTDLAARRPPVLAVDTEHDENGPHHQTLYFYTARSRTF